VRKDVNSEFIRKLGNRIREVRLEKGVSMKNLAYSCNIEYSQISRIERGLINTSVNNIYLISEVLEVDPKDLLDFGKK
jgi:transcriptional regulator with XRE-family HTH domain